MSDTELMTDPADVPEPFDDDMSDEDYDALEVVAMNASMTAIGSVHTEEFEAMQSAIATATVDGDASVSASVIGVLSAGSIGIHQGGAAMIIADGDVSIDQGGAQMIVAQTVGIDQGAVGTLVAGEATLAHSWVGVMAARNATLSDDSRVIVDTRSAFIIGGALLAGLAAVALALFLGSPRSEY